MQGQCYSVHTQRIKVITPTTLIWRNNKLNENIDPTFGWWQSNFIAPNYVLLLKPIYLNKSMFCTDKDKGYIDMYTEWILRGPFLTLSVRGG